MASFFIAYNIVNSLPTIETIIVFALFGNNFRISNKEKKQRTDHEKKTEANKIKCDNYTISNRESKKITFKGKQ